MLYKKLIKYWRTFWLFRAFQLKVQLEYRGDFIFWSVVAVMWTSFNFFFYRILAGINNGIAGWDVNEITVLMSLYTLFDAFTWSFMYLNMERYTNAIFSGEMNKYLAQPIDPQFRLMTQYNSFNGIFRLILGISVLIGTLQLMAIQTALLDWILLITLFISSVSFIYFLWFFVSTFTFWVEKLDNINHVIPAFRHIWQIPRQAYHPVWVALVFQIIPIGLVISVPSEIILKTNNISPFLVMYIFASTMAMFLLSRWFFLFSVKKYTGVAN